MSRAALRQLIGRQPDARALLSLISDALGSPVAIEDVDGHLLHGQTSQEPAITTRFPITHQDTSLGWVSGPGQVGAVAALLGHLIAKEAERKALGAEVLHLYREINLIYSFSEKLAALLDVEGVAQLTLQEARHLIVATDGLIMLLNDDGVLTSIAGFGDEMSALTEFRRGFGIIGSIAASGNGEIVNDVDSDARRIIEQTSIKALICAPLKVGERVTGIIALGSTIPMAYTAAELKLLNTLALQTATAIENARLFERTVQAARERERLMALHKEAEVARAKLDSELTLAARIQAQLFPAEMPQVDGYELAARNRPARRCGGDYYDALPVIDSVGGTRMLLCVADVAGKGLPAALVMSNMQATLRALLGRTRSLPDLAALASGLLYGSTSPEKYVTAALAELVPATGTLRFVGAGHLDNVILRANGDAVPLTSTGMPLGLLPLEVPYGETGQTLEAGDALVLFSDGVTDAQNEEGEEFGELRLLNVLRDAAGTAPDALIGCVLAAIDSFVGGAAQFDDITLLVARRLPAT